MCPPRSEGGADRSSQNWSSRYKWYLWEVCGDNICSNMLLCFQIPGSHLSSCEFFALLWLALTPSWQRADISPRQGRFLLQVSLRLFASFGVNLCLVEIDPFPASKSGYSEYCEQRWRLPECRKCILRCYLERCRYDLVSFLWCFQSLLSSISINC